MTVPQKLALLREKMRAHGVNAVIVTTEDFHGSEYVGEHFKLREYLSGFDGSAGTLAVTERGAALWTDGRYFLQAGRRLSGSGIALMKQGEKGVPKLSDRRRGRQDALPARGARYRESAREKGRKAAP